MAPHIYSCILVEDNAIDSLMAQAMLKRYDFLRLDAVMENASDALAYLKTQPVDVLLTDVEMEGLSGLELRRRAMNLQACVFITSHPEYAADSYDLSALDYIVKPYDGVRFDVAMKRLRDYLEIRRKAQLFDYTIGEQSIFIKEGTSEVKVDLNSVLYLEALRDYTRVVTTQKEHCVLATLQHMLDREVFRGFVRIHRSYAVQWHYVQRKDTHHVHLPCNVSLPVGRSYREVLSRPTG